MEAKVRKLFLKINCDFIFNFRVQIRRTATKVAMSQLAMKNYQRMTNPKRWKFSMAKMWQ
jgi:hypothetical protein